MTDVQILTGLTLQAPASIGPSRCVTCGQMMAPQLHAISSNSSQTQQHRRPSDRFIKPAIPAPQPASPMDTSVNKD